MARLQNPPSVRAASFTGGKLCHRSQEHPPCPTPCVWRSVGDGNPVSNFESEWRGGDVGGTGPPSELSCSSLSQAEPAWLCQQPSVSRVAHLHLHPLPRSENEMRKGELKEKEGKKIGLEVMARGDAHISSLSLLTDRFGGRRS